MIPRYTVLPFLIALVVGLAPQGLPIYQVNAWNAGTVKIEPWRASTAAPGADRARPGTWLSSLWHDERGFISPDLLIGGGGRPLADDVIGQAFAASTEADLSALRQAFDGYRASVRDTLMAAFTKMRDEGRETPQAAEQRAFDKTRSQLQHVTQAFDEAVARVRGAAVSRFNRFGPAGGPTPATDFRSIFPSMREYRNTVDVYAAQGTSSDPAGGYIVRAEVGEFFDRLRPSSVVLEAGPRVETCEGDALELPGLGSSTTVRSVGEHADISESEVSLAKVRIPMRKYAIYTRGSSEWFEDSAYGPRQLIETDHRLQLGARLDKDMLEGNTASGIVGLRRQSGVTVTELGAGNGLAPTLDNVIDALDRLERDECRGSAIFMHPRTWAVFRKLKDGQSRYQMQPDPTTDTKRSLFNVPVFLSSQISITETVGGSTDCSYIIIADMRYVVAVRRQSVMILYDPFTYSKSDQIAIRSTTRWGLGVIHREAVEVLTGVRT